MIWGDAEYAKTAVYGNLFYFTPATAKSTNPVKYGGDSVVTAHYRQYTLLFYNNTMVERGDAWHECERDAGESSGGDVGAQAGWGD